VIKWFNTDQLLSGYFATKRVLVPVISGKQHSNKVLKNEIYMQRALTMMPPEGIDIFKLMSDILNNSPETRSTTSSVVLFDDFVH
jgi:hypothetical protein